MKQKLLTEIIEKILIHHNGFSEEDAKQHAQEAGGDELAESLIEVLDKYNVSLKK